MTLSLSEIPSAEERPAGPHRKSGALSLAETSPRRRTVLRMATISAAALGGTVLSWGTRGMAGVEARADVVPLAPSEWTTCRVNYDPDRDTGGDYYNSPPACNGGSYRSRAFCRNHWHRTDSEAAGPATKDYSRVNNRCWSSADGKNAWRWRAADGHTYRCSDGKMKVCASGGCRTYNTVCRYRL